MNSCGVGLILWLLFLAGDGWAEVQVITRSESPDHTLALGFDEFSAHGERLWLVSLPSKKTIGQPLALNTDSFIGLPYHGGAFWNTSRSLVALTQGGIPYSETKLFRYSKRGLEALDLPDLEDLPDRHYHFVPATAAAPGADRIQRQRTYVSARRWIGKDTLLMSVSGTAKREDGEKKEFWTYELLVRLAVDKSDKAKITKIVKTPLEAL